MNQSYIFNLRPIYKRIIYPRFLNNPHYKNEGMLVAVKDGEIVGFGNATYNNGSTVSYPRIYYMCSCEKGYWRQGIGTKYYLL